MKRLSAILIFVAFVAVASAQEPIRYGDSCYWFIPYNDSGYLDPSGLESVVYIPDSTVAVYGLAVTFTDNLLSDSSVNILASIFEREDRYDLGARFWRTDSICRKRGTVRRSFEFFTIHNHNDDHTYGPWREHRDTVGVLEFYFDRPHYVNDTFVLSIDHFSSLRDSSGSLYRTYGVQTINTPITRGLLFSDNILDGFLMTEDYHSSDPHQGIYRLVMYGEWGSIFPIIDFRCDTAVRNLHAVLSEGLVAWDNDESALYQVAVGMYNKPPDSAFMVFTTADTAVVLDTLPHGEYYGVWVRRQCHYAMATYDTVVWSPWGNRMLVYMPLSIEAAASGVPFTMSPNPASGTVRLTCGEAVLAVEVTDLTGRRVLARQQPNNGQLDISTLPAGIYTVHVTTPSGIGVQRLVVE